MVPPEGVSASVPRLSMGTAMRRRTSKLSRKTTSASRSARSASPQATLYVATANQHTKREW